MSPPAADVNRVKTSRATSRSHTSAFASTTRSNAMPGRRATAVDSPAAYRRECRLHGSAFLICQTRRAVCGQ
jgi:hypothetical protein